MGGLSENDFMMAAKIDEITTTYESQQGRAHITAASVPLTATTTIQKGARKERNIRTQQLPKSY